MIPRDPSFTAYGDASIMAGGGYSFDLRFWWHLEWPSEIHHRTIKFWDDNKERLVSINLLEFIVIILNYAASLLAIRTSPPPHDPYPVLRNFADNRSAIQWSSCAAKSSPHAQALGRILSDLLLTSPLALDSSFIPGVENTVADAISRSDLTSYLKLHAALTQAYPSLASCRRYHPSPELLSVIFSALSDASTPNLGKTVPLGLFSPASATGRPLPQNIT